MVEATRILGASHLQEFGDGGIDSDPWVGLLKTTNHLCSFLPAEGSERRKQGCFRSSRLSDVFDLNAFNKS
jgi:hypothetical protein